MRRLASLALVSLAALGMSGCMSMPQDGRNSLATTTSLAYFPKKTQTQTLLNQLPPPQRPVAIAVYGFTDQTGQFKPSETGQTLSRAVTQGASSILVKALQDAGNRNWFTVVERERLDNLLKERQIIGEMRKRYLGEQEVDPNALPALLFAGVLLEGGIVGYDTNTVTGGAGAAFLGIGARTEYRQDTVTVYLRAVSVRTGEVLADVTAPKPSPARRWGQAHSNSSPSASCWKPRRGSHPTSPIRSRCNRRSRRRSTALCSRAWSSTCGGSTTCRRPCRCSPPIGPSAMDFTMPATSRRRSSGQARSPR